MIYDSGNMASNDSGKKYKETKKLYSQRYRKTHHAEIKAYEKTPKSLKTRESRNSANALMKKSSSVKSFKNKEVIHKDSNPLNNKKSNLLVVKRSRGGGKKGNHNRK